MEHNIKHILRKHRKLVGAAILGLFLAIVFIPSSGLLTPSDASNPNTVGKDKDSQAGSGFYGKHTCYLRANGLPEGCRTPP